MKEEQTIFLVDDEPAVLKGLSRLLRAEGYRTETFNSGRMFMEQYKPGAGGCLVLDLSMPGISGLDVQEWLANSGHPLPTIFLTAQDDIPAQMQLLLDRAAGVLMKPVSASALLRSIEEATGRRV